MVFGSLILVGCGTSSPTEDNSSTTETSTTEVSNTDERKNKDFGPYQWQEYVINQTKDLSDFRVTLNKIIIGNQNFWKYEDGYASTIMTGYVSQWIIGEFTFVAKYPTNLSSVQFSIWWDKNGGGSSFTHAVRQGKLSTGAIKFGFFQDGLDVSMTGNESKDLKVIIPLQDQFSGNGPYTFQVSSQLYSDDLRKQIEFDLSQYLVY